MGFKNPQRFSGRLPVAEQRWRSIQVFCFSIFPDGAFFAREAGFPIYTFHYSPQNQSKYEQQIAERYGIDGHNSRMCTAGPDLWWTESGSPGIFAELSPRCWQNQIINAVAVLREVSDYETGASPARGFRRGASGVLQKFEATFSRRTLGEPQRAGIAEKSCAYFSAIGLP